MEIKLKANLFIPGVGKSGTSSLHLYLNQHPEVSMSKIKEPQFFCMEERFKMGFEYYNSLFDVKKGAKYYGESSTSYIGSEIAIERIKKYAEAPKFIILLRNPIDRMYSHYTWLSMLGKEHLPFKQAILKDIDSVFDPNNPIDGMGFRHYFFFSKYGTLAEKYIAAFGKENIHIITTEELKGNPLETLNRCFAFLNISKIEHLEVENENVTNAIKLNKTPAWIKRISYYLPSFVKGSFVIKRVISCIFIRRYRDYPMDNADRKWLCGLLKDEVKKLKKITSYQYPEWADFVSI